MKRPACLRGDGRGWEGPAPGRVAGARHSARFSARSVEAKPDEILAVRDLLQAFTDLAGAVITIDSNIPAANRHHARDPRRTLALLQTA